MNVMTDVRCERALPDVDRLEALCVFALRQESAPETCELSLSFVDDDEIAELNARWRHREGPTDVLSFPMDEPDADGAGVVELGDIVIAPDVAYRQSADYGDTFVEELELLLVHGVLHLLGYDHVDDGEAVVMESRERDILSSWRS
ncbi:MAG: rRNA maturation RNase YbeY [Coriobacteriales bacterium]